MPLGAVDGREVERQEKSQSGTQQRGFPVCFGPCCVVEGVATEHWKQLPESWNSFCALCGSFGSRREGDEMESGSADAVYRRQGLCRL